MSAEPALVPEAKLAGSTGMPPPQETGVTASERQPDSSEPAQQLQPPLTPLSEASDEDGLALLPKHTVRWSAEDKLGTDEHDAGRRNLLCCCLSVAMANVMFIRPFRLLPGRADNRQQSDEAGVHWPASCRPSSCRPGRMALAGAWRRRACSVLPRVSNRCIMRHQCCLMGIWSVRGGGCRRRLDRTCGLTMGPGPRPPPCRSWATGRRSSCSATPSSSCSIPPAMNRYVVEDDGIVGTPCIDCGLVGPPMGGCSNMVLVRASVRRTFRTRRRTSRSWHPVLEQQRRHHTQVQGGCVGECHGVPGDRQTSSQAARAARTHWRCYWYSLEYKRDL